MRSDDARPMSTPRSQRRTPPKSTLFCRCCDHESPIGGDWRVRDDGRGYECPQCGTPVAARGPVDTTT
jgi:hypothetical protein